MKTSPALIGPVAAVLAAARSLASSRDRVAILLDGDPGIGKTAALDQLAAGIAGNAFAIEHVNGQSLSVDLVRQWRERSHVRQRLKLHTSILNPVLFQQVKPFMEKGSSYIYLEAADFSKRYKDAVQADEPPATEEDEAYAAAGGAAGTDAE